jgi:alcohol dehydrogenase class IV
MAKLDNARRLITRFKGDTYTYGISVLPSAGTAVATLGRRAVLVQGTSLEAGEPSAVLRDALGNSGVSIAGVVPGARPNTPREDVMRIASALGQSAHDVVLSFGGGSTVDATKAAIVLHELGGDIGQYFGVGLVTKALQAAGKSLTPHVAVQTAAGSSAHLTKYSNITDLQTGQKSLIVDDAIVPSRAVFDYALTTTAPASLTVDGGLDAISHILEVLYSLAGKPSYALMKEVASEGLSLIFKHLPVVLRDPADLEAREGLGLATDLGGYAIMTGGTNGGHLNSFSLVGILTHGRACGLLNPYYTVFFAPAIPGPLRLVAGLIKKAGYAEASIDRFEGRRLGEAVARGLIAFMRDLGVPTKLSEVPGFNQAHIVRALAAAKAPHLKMKLESMPVPLTTAMVDDYMGRVLQAAMTGDLSLIKNIA